MVKSTNTVTKKHQDRGLAAKAAFESTAVDIQTPQTMILLLESKEDMVILKALSTLDKYAAKLEQNAQIIYEEGILKLIPTLLNHPELHIRRFATKLLSELSFLPQVSEILIEDKQIPSIVTLLNSDDDLVVREFCLSIIAELTKTNVGKAQLVCTNQINTLIPMLTSYDPDVQKNCLQIIFNMVEDPYDHTILTTQCADFNIKVLIDLLGSDYVAIQNLSLDVLNILTFRRKENLIPRYFQEAGGVMKILSILRNFEWKDIHAKCLDILGNIYDDGTLAQHFVKDGVLQLFTYMDFVNDPYLRKKAVEIIAKIAKTTLGRKIIHEGGKIEKIVSMLSEQSIGMAEVVSECVLGLTQDYEALQLMLALDTLPSLLSIAYDQERDWDTRTAAIKAISHIIDRDYNSCLFIINSDKHDVFEIILSQFEGSVPINSPIIAANCIQTLANHSELRQKIISVDCISSLLHCFKVFNEDTTMLKVCACDTLCSLLSEPEARRYLKSEQGLAIVWSSLTKVPQTAQLLQTAATFVHVCVTSDKTLTSNFLQMNVLNWLLSQSSLRNECPNWETALESLLTRFLPIKFAMTGRLDLTDITESSFYITKLPLKMEDLKKGIFPILNNCINDNSCPIQTLYVANFDTGEMKRSSGSSILQKSTLGTDTHKSLDSLKFRFNDVYLLNYIDCLKTVLSQNRYSYHESSGEESVIDGDIIQGKALLIGQFVTNQMGGLDKMEPCSIHTVDLHINELKVEVLNSIIPVGYMRVGVHVERAFLFKVLADRVGLPASLVRGGYNHRAWVEVAIPKVLHSPRPSYPSHLLKPNYVVDLMSTPVVLLPLGCYEANKYCGLI